MGVLSALPFVSVGNVCCCLWVICGGLVAAYVLQQNTSAPIAPGDGAIVGWLAGLAGAVIQLLVSIPLDLLVGPMQREMLRRVVEAAGPLPPEIRDAFERGGNREAATGLFMVLGWIFGLFFWLVIGGVFSTIGGLLGAAIFRKSTPPGTLDITPVPPPAEDFTRPRLLQLIRVSSEKSGRDVRVSAVKSPASHNRRPVARPDVGDGLVADPASPGPGASEASAAAPVPAADAARRARAVGRAG